MKPKPVKAWAVWCPIENGYRVQEGRYLVMTGKAKQDCGPCDTHIRVQIVPVKAKGNGR